MRSIRKREGRKLLGSLRKALRTTVLVAGLALLPRCGNDVTEKKVPALNMPKAGKSASKKKPKKAGIPDCNETDVVHQKEYMKRYALGREVKEEYERLEFPLGPCRARKGTGVLYLSRDKASNIMYRVDSVSDTGIELRQYVVDYWRARWGWVKHTANVRGRFGEGIADGLTALPVRIKVKFGDTLTLGYNGTVEISAVKKKTSYRYLPETILTVKTSTPRNAEGVSLGPQSRW